MTSFTKALYRRDPAAANEFHRQSTFEHKMTYGKTPTLACFTPAHHGLGTKERPMPSFGLRPQPEDHAAYACAASCGHPACKHGCTRWSR